MFPSVQDSAPWAAPHADGYWGVTRSTILHKTSGQSGLPNSGKCEVLPYQTHISAPEESFDLSGAGYYGHCGLLC